MPPQENPQHAKRKAYTKNWESNMDTSKLDYTLPNLFIKNIRVNANPTHLI